MSLPDDTTQSHANAKRICDMLGKGYSYLFKKGRTKCHWEEVRSTALAGICLAIKERKSSPWREGVERWIREQQIPEGKESAGSWGEEIWDTSMSVLALKHLGVPPSDPVIRNAFEWIERIRELNPHNCWHYEPWETSWALIAILNERTNLSSDEKSRLLSAVDWLAKLQDDTGKIVSPHYTGYFVMIHKLLRDWQEIHGDVLLGERADAFRRTRDRAVQFLLNLLCDSQPAHLWTNEAWSNGQILWALAESNLFPVAETDLVNKTIRWFEEKQDERPSEGNWDDIEDTACAILGLLFLWQNLESRSLADLIPRLDRDAPAPPPRARWIAFERQSGMGRTIFISDRFLYWAGGIVTAVFLVYELVDKIWSLIKTVVSWIIPN